MTRTSLCLRTPCVLFLCVAIASCGGADSGTTPKDDPVASVTISPLEPTVDIGASTTLSATVRTASGADVTASSEIVWSADAPAIATVEGAGATAVVRGVARGSGGIRAKVDDAGGRVTVTVTDPNRPAAPSSVVGVPVSTSEIVVGWTDNADNETGFRIEREEVTGSGSGGGPAAVFQQIDQAGVNATSYRDRSIDPAASYRYLVRACNQNGCAPAEGSAAEAEATSEPVTVYGGAPSITTTGLPDARYDLNYSEHLAVVGGDGDYAWAVVAGELPTGLELDASSGEIRGVPDAVGSWTFTVEVTSEGATDERELTITVVSSTLSLTTRFLPGGYPGVPYDDGVASAGGDGTIAFSVTGGALPSGVALDEETGALTGTPTEPGAYYFTVEAVSGEQSAVRTFAVAISTKPPEAFNMWIANVTIGDAVPEPEVIEALSEALARWEMHIVGDLDEVVFEPDEIASDACSGEGARLNGQHVDDMVILLRLGFIDGIGGTVGSATPCFIRILQDPPDVNAIFGLVRLDTDDLMGLSEHQRFALLFHEIGHVLGIGTFWTLGTDLPTEFGFSDLMSGDGTADPRYEGARGNAVFTDELGGGSQDASKIPIEADGGAGTAYGHWDEGEFNTEIMTGSLEAAGVTNRISAMTIEALADLAYEVSTEGVDLYSVPGCAPNCSNSPPAGVAAPGEGGVDLGDDIVRNPIGARLPDGRIIYLDPPAGR